MLLVQRERQCSLLLFAELETQDGANDTVLSTTDHVREPKDQRTAVGDSYSGAVRTPTA